MRFASASDTSIHRASSAGASTRTVSLRYSGARNTALRSSKYLASTSGVGEGESELTRTLVERRLGDNLSQHLLVEAERTRLIGRDRPAQSAADLPQAVVVSLPELLDRDLGPADLGDGGAAESAKNVAD